MSITDLLVICSGADRNALAHRPNYERQRAAAVGASVLLTGLFAFVSATYVGYLIFRSRAASVAVGLSWAAVIFTLDRFLLLSVRRPSDRRLSPMERVRETRLAFVATIPRLVLAAVIALPIAIPLQLRLFEREIDEELVRRRAEAIAQARSEAEGMFPERRTLEAKNAELEVRVIEKEKRVDDLLDAMLGEPSGSLTGRVFEERRRAYVQGRSDLEDLRRTTKQQIAENNDRLSAIRRAVDERQSDVFLSLRVGSPTFLARLDAMNSLKERNRAIARMSTMLLALFIVIQIMPVITQLLTSTHRNAEFWEAVSVMADQSRSPIVPAHPVTPVVSDSVADKTIDIQPPPIRPPRSEALRVFMCHCSEDKPVVRALTQQLQDASVDAWIDKERLLPGQRWEDEITKAVRNSDAVIICLSRQAVRKRGFVQREIRFAMKVALEQPQGSIFLIPAKLEECDVPLDLEQYQYVRMHEPSGYPHLLKSLTERATELGRITPEERVPAQT